MARFGGLALELLLQTGAARCDMVRMGRQHVKNGTLSMRRLKTNVPFDIPVVPSLVAELELHAKDQLTFLTTEYGKPFTAAVSAIGFESAVTRAAAAMRGPWPEKSRCGSSCPQRLNCSRIDGLVWMEDLGRGAALLRGGRPDQTGRGASDQNDN
jgi:hypothetical protein